MGNSLLEKIDYYFYLGGKKATVIQGSAKNDHEEVNLSESQISQLEKIGKIISYCTIILPFFLLIAKVALRSTHSFEVVDLNNKSEANEAPSKNTAEKIQKAAEGKILSEPNIRKMKIRNPTDPLSINHSLSPGQIGQIEITPDGVFTAEGVAPTGERIYFAMEPLADDRKKWERYKDEVECIVKGGYPGCYIGSLLEIAARVNDEAALKGYLATQPLSDYWTSNQSKFEDLCAKLRERPMAAGSSKAKELSTIPHASDGLNVRQQTHMVYISKSPITGRFDNTRYAHYPRDFGGYMGCYGNLIMCVGSNIYQEGVVENRGIFRNPLSVVEGGYGGLAMMIHSFTCLTVEQIRPDVKSFRVRPLKKMGDIFMSSLPKEEIMVNGIRGDKYDKGFEYEQDVRVSLEILANLHRAK